MRADDARTLTEAALDAGERVRVFGHRHCWLHGSPGRIVRRLPSGERAIELEGDPGPVVYLHEKAIEGFERYRPIRGDAACGMCPGW